MDDPLTRHASRGAKTLSFGTFSEWNSWLPGFLACCLLGFLASWLSSAFSFLASWLLGFFFKSQPLPSTHTRVSKAMMRGLCLQMGGAAPPPTPPLFMSRKLASKNKRFFSKLMTRALCLRVGGGGLRPPQTPLFKSRKLASKHTSFRDP